MAPSHHAEVSIACRPHGEPRHARGQLFLGIETVKSHVRSILAKLGVRDRVQAVIVAFESGFVPAG